MSLVARGLSGRHAHRSPHHRHSIGNLGMMTSLVSSVIEFLTAHRPVAYLAVFILALSESIPIIGVVVPGTAVILALSTLVPSGGLVLWPLLIAATLGAIVGDGL